MFARHSWPDACSVRTAAVANLLNISGGKQAVHKMGMDGSTVVTLSTFVSLSVNSAKGLSRWAERCFAALILRCAQDDRAGTPTDGRIILVICIIGPLQIACKQFMPPKNVISM